MTRSAIIAVVKTHRVFPCCTWGYKRIARLQMVRVHVYRSDGGKNTNQRTAICQTPNDGFGCAIPDVERTEQHNPCKRGISSECIMVPDINSLAVQGLQHRVIWFKRLVNCLVCNRLQGFSLVLSLQNSALYTHKSISCNGLQYIPFPAVL